MIFDLHVHTRERSACSHQIAEDLILQAVTVGLDGIALTDHDTVWPEDKLQTVLRRVGAVPLVILRGQEVSCTDGHLLVYGIDRVLSGSNTCAQTADGVRKKGGASILAHPFRWGRFSGCRDEEIIQAFRKFDAVECCTTNHTRGDHAKARTFRGIPGVRLVGGSDAHALDRVGHYATEFAGPIKDEHDLVAALRQGDFAPMHQGPNGGFIGCR